MHCVCVEQRDRVHYVSHTHTQPLSQWDYLILVALHVVCAHRSQLARYIKNLITYGYNMHIYNYLHKFFFSSFGFSLSYLYLYTYIFGMVIFDYWTNTEHIIPRVKKNMKLFSFFKVAVSYIDIFCRCLSCNQQFFFFFFEVENPLWPRSECIFKILLQLVVFHIFFST